MFPNLKDALVRAAKTFWQAALPALALPAANLYSLSAWKGAVITAGAAGASAAYSLVVKPTFTALGKALAAKAIASRFGTTIAEIEKALAAASAVPAAVAVPAPVATSVTSTVPPPPPVIVPVTTPAPAAVPAPSAV